MKATELVLTLALVVVSLAFLETCSRAKDERQRYEGNINALTDSVEITRTKLGETISEKSALQLTSREQMLKLQDLSGTNRQLQETVRRQKNTIAAISGTTRTEIIYITDSVEAVLDNAGNITFIKHFSDKWKEGWVMVNRDSLRLSILMRNELDFSISESRSMLKPSTYTITARSANPEVYVDDMSGLIITPKKKRWVAGPMIGYGFGQGKFDIFVGVGLTYNIASF